MSSLKESVVEGLLDVFDVHCRYNIEEQCQKWADGYVKQLEEHLQEQRSSIPPLR